VAENELDRQELEELDWSATQRSASLTRIFMHAVGLARTMEAWYSSHRRWDRLAGRALRVAALILGTVAAIIPILAEIYGDGDRPGIAPGWSAVALAGAAALVALDRFYGFTAAWTRYMTAELRIERLRHEFEYAWQAARAAADDPPTETQTFEMLTLARALVLAVDDVVAAETGAWVTEFRSALDRAEEVLGSSDPP
jgi:hypothetical protein